VARRLLAQQGPAVVATAEEVRLLARAVLEGAASTPTRNVSEETA
jgi:hypothetical protein